MDSPKKHIVIVAGETSGDMHAAHLVDAIKKIDPSVRFSGLGGPQMKECGVDIYFDLTQIAVVGFFEVLKHYSEFKKVFDDILKKIKETKPDAVILVDYPGFNLRLAKAIRQAKIPTKIIYYISPQVWAWKANRVFQIKKNVDKMLVLFKFEVDFYKRFGMDVDFVGHPLIDIVQPSVSKEDFLRSIGFEDYKFTVGLLPGSRRKEVEKHLPVMLKAAALLKKDFPMLQCLIMKAPGIDVGNPSNNEKPENSTSEAKKKSPSFFKIIENNTYNAINACDACMVTSGTATLETAVLQKPMVVMYKTSFLTWVIAKLLIKIPNIGLVNVVAGKRIVPECVQFDATGEKIATEIKRILSDDLKRNEIRRNLIAVKDSLGPGGAADRAAGKILAIL